MGKDVSDVIGAAIGKTAREAIQNVSKSARKRSKGSLPAPKGVAAGAAGLGLMALAPLAAKGAGKLATGAADKASRAVDKGTDQLKGAGDKVGSKVQDTVGSKVRDKVKDDVKDAIPGSGLFSKSGKSEGAPGVGKGRRMPVQQDIDIGVPIGTVYNEWTQFEEWPKFMHRVTSVSQEDDTHVAFKTKIWGKTKEFTAEIEEQRPDERIKWRVTEGVSHSGVVTFHEIGPRLTRVELNLDIEPGSLIEKAARGMRHVKRAVRADLARFKAHVLMEEEESGKWRGTIEDGDVKKSSSGRGRSSSGRSRTTSKSSASKPSASKPSASRSSGSKSSSSGSQQSRARSSSRRTRGATNGSGESSRSGGRSGSSRRRAGSHS